MACCNTSSSDQIFYSGPDLSCIPLYTNENLTIALQKINDKLCTGGIDQNNFVRSIIINDYELPYPYTEEDIITYVLGLPEEQRTIAETDSKWNIVVVEFVC